jgi:predicted RND superfamily exporter protein
MNNNNNQRIETIEAEKEGKRFWNKFKNSLKTIICNNPKIQELMNGEGDLTSYLKVITLLLLAALGITLITPILLAAIAAILAIIIKIGFNTYCDVS